MKPSAAQLDLVSGAATREAEGERRAPSRSSPLAVLADAKRKLAQAARLVPCSAGGFHHHEPTEPPPGSPPGAWLSCRKCGTSWCRP